MSLPDWYLGKHSRICGIHSVGLRRSKSHPEPTVLPLRKEKRYSCKSRRAVIQSTPGNVEIGTDHSSLDTDAGDVFEAEPPVVTLEEEVERLTAEDNLLQRTESSLERFKNNRWAFKYHTGLTDYSVFKIMYDTLFRACLSKLVYHRSGDTGTTVSATRRVIFHRRTLDPEMECFMFMSILAATCLQSPPISALQLQRALSMQPALDRYKLVTLGTANA